MKTNANKQTKTTTTTKKSTTHTKKWEQISELKDAGFEIMEINLVDLTG